MKKNLINFVFSKNADIYNKQQVVDRLNPTTTTI